MKVKQWLIVNSRGSVRVRTTKPAMKWNEIALLLEVNLPDALFRRPRLEAKVTIPEEAAGTETINANVVENVREAIESATGLNFDISVIKHEEEGDEKQ